VQSFLAAAFSPDTWCSNLPEDAGASRKCSENKIKTESVDFYQVQTIIS
jgi:hypothetical protein